jgi:hypothetical protein
MDTKKNGHQESGETRHIRDDATKKHVIEHESRNIPQLIKNPHKETVATTHQKENHDNKEGIDRGRIKIIDARQSLQNTAKRFAPLVVLAEETTRTYKCMRTMRKSVRARQRSEGRQWGLGSGRAKKDRR